MKHHWIKIQYLSYTRIKLLQLNVQFSKLRVKLKLFKNGVLFFTIYSMMIKYVRTYVDLYLFKYHSPVFISTMYVPYVRTFDTAKELSIVLMYVRSIVVPVP